MFLANHILIQSKIRSPINYMVFYLEPHMCAYAVVFIQLFKEQYRIQKQIQDVYAQFLKMKPIIDIPRMPKKLEADILHVIVSEVQN